MQAPGDLIADGLESVVSRAVDDDDRLVRLLLTNPIEHLAEQVEWLVDDGDHHADGRSVGGGPGSVAPGEQDLDGPQNPDSSDEHGEEVEWMAMLERVAKLQEEREQRRRPFLLASGATPA
jgi:hypothetical protein